jgi:hypothetical protein
MRRNGNLEIMVSCDNCKHLSTKNTIWRNGETTGWCKVLEVEVMVKIKRECSCYNIAYKTKRIQDEVRV